MKNLILIALLFTGLSTYAQVELSPMVGYFFGGKSNFYEGGLKINDNINYGLHLGFDAGGHTMLELSYAISASEAQWRPNFSYVDLLPSREFDIQTHMFLIGGTKGVELSNPKLIGFGTFKAGAVYYNVTEGGISDVWRFMINFGAGVKYFFTDKVGIKFQGNMYMPMYFNGGGIYCGIGSGGSNCGASVNSTVVIFQGDLTAGLIFKLGQ